MNVTSHGVAHIAAVARADHHGISTAATVRWGCVFGFGLIVVILVGTAAASRGRWKALFVGDDHRLSTSRTVATTWTVIVAAALFGVVYASLLNHPKPLATLDNSGVIGQYALLFGGPLGAAILAKQIVTSQIANGAVKTTAASASPHDLIADDSGNTDLGDLQYVLFNVIAMVYVIGTLLHNPASGLPHIPDTMLGLTSVSAAGYVGKKALVPAGAQSAQLDPETCSGAAGTTVGITLTNLTTTKSQLPVWVQFGKDLGGQSIHTAEVDSGQATLSLTAPALDVDVDTKVSVTVVTEDGAVLSAGSFKYNA